MKDNKYHHQIRTKARDQSASQNRQIKPKINIKEKEQAFESMNLKKVPELYRLIDLCLQCLQASPTVFYEIFNKFLELEYFPLACKFAQVILIPKPSLEGQSMKEMRPRGLLPFYPKVLERIIYQILLWQINKKKRPKQKALWIFTKKIKMMMH